MLTAEDMALRRTRIGSSEVGALLGIDPFKTQHSVFLEKTLPKEQEGEDHRTWGLDLEPAILAFHVRKSGYQSIPPPAGRERWPSIAHPSAPLCCTPDALAVADAALIDLQAKNDQGWGQIEWGEPGTDDAPLLYVAQVTTEIGVLRAAGHEVDHGELVVSIRGAPPVSYRIDYDAEVFGRIVEVVEKFKRDHLDTGVPPGATASEAAEYIRRRFPTHDERLLDPTPDLVTLVQAVRKLKASDKSLAAEILAAENQLKAAIGDASGIRGMVTWKTQKGSTYTVTKKPGRVLRISADKEEGARP